MPVRLCVCGVTKYATAEENTELLSIPLKLCFSFIVDSDGEERPDTPGYPLYSRSHSRPGRLANRAPNLPLQQKARNPGTPQLLAVTSIVSLIKEFLARDPGTDSRLTRWASLALEV
ncbi:hypothetical protein BaRGS_00002335 [Batillaria attramentaria]|uniref:Uncharacterized protein n=1 Tax=Batillaria attramentaria TaxID=370345 RepID=A0ABD0M4M1_9CAEN